MFKVGDRVVKNPETWQPSDFDAWGAGVGVGIVVEAHESPDDWIPSVDVRWEGGRCYQLVTELLPAPSDSARASASGPA